jgi:hypothetical protein
MHRCWLANCHLRCLQPQAATRQAFRCVQLIIREEYPHHCHLHMMYEQRTSSVAERLHGVLDSMDAQYVDFGSVQRTVRVQYAVRCLVRCLYAAVKGT